MSPAVTRPSPGTRRAARASAPRSERPEADGSEVDASEPDAPSAKAVEPSTPTKGNSRTKAAATEPAPRSRAAARPVPTTATWWKVVAVIGVLGTIGFGLAWRGAQAEAVTEDGVSPAVVEMRTAARDFAIALTNFDASTIDADFDRIVDSATGEFAEEADRFYDEQIRSDLRDAQASSQSEVTSLYVQSYTGDAGSVFVTIDQTVVNNLSPQPVTDTLRIELGMAQVDGDWKVRTVEVLDAPPGAQLDGSGLPDGAPAEDDPAAEGPATSSAPAGG